MTNSQLLHKIRMVAIRDGMIPVSLADIADVRLYIEAVENENYDRADELQKLIGSRGCLK